MMFLLLRDWLAYASRPNIPSEEIPPRLPEKAISKLVKRLNNPPKDLSSLYSIITDYLALAKKLNVDQSECRQLLVTFCASYTKLKDEEKIDVKKTIYKCLSQTNTHDIEHLHSILEFAGSKLPDNKDHLFPTEISLAIAETIRATTSTAYVYGSILEQAIQLAKENKETVELFFEIH